MASLKIKEISSYLESLAPIPTQENYDNSGLLVGNKNDDVNGVLVSLDCTEAVVLDAIKQNCNLIVCHHPIIFSGLKKLNGNSYIERAIIAAIKNNVAIYAIHTNLDNSIKGVNKEIGERMGLNNLSILNPKKNQLLKLRVYVPSSHMEEVADAIFKNGGGNIGNYDECSFRLNGEGTFRPNENADPYIGNINKRHEDEECLIETVIPWYKESIIMDSVKTAHPYEEIAYDVLKLENVDSNIGSGMIGELEKSMKLEDFLAHIKKTFNTGAIKFTKDLKKPIKKVAFCGGSGFFLLKNAISSKADVYLTSDIKYHEFFDAEDKIILMDIGHFESEQYTIQLLAREITKKFPNFAVCLTSENTNPVNYF
jgi:dinuclear metal center YbgI/SA1388 family protein